MTSDGTRECFVYVVLPGETAFVPAARFQLTADRTGAALGRLVYGRTYLARQNAVPIDPVELPLAPGTFETRGLDGLFGALRDAGPDHWGRRLIERHSDRQPLDELDYLLLAPDDRAGALGFGLNAEPPPPRRLFNRTLELETLQRLADAIVAEERLPDEPVVGKVQELLLIGTAMGGARPKVVVEDEDALWIANTPQRATGARECSPPSRCCAPATPTSTAGAGRTFCWPRHCAGSSHVRPRLRQNCSAAWCSTRWSPIPTTTRATTP